MALSQVHRSYLIREHVIGPALINFALNALIGWATFRGQSSIPVWGEQAAVPDLVVTMFLLPVIVCLIVTPLVRLAARRGKAPALTEGTTLPAYVRLLPHPLWLRALALGLLGLVVAGGLVMAGFAASGIGAMGVNAFAICKGVACALEAAAISPALALRAMAETSPAPTTITA